MNSIAVVLIGNSLLQDDGAGIHVLTHFEQHHSDFDVTWLDALIANIKAGETRSFNEELWEPKSWPKSCQGVGATEARNWFRSRSAETGA